MFPVWGDPQQTNAWSVYVDNLDQSELFLASELEGKHGTKSNSMSVAESQYRVWSSKTNPGEEVNRSTTVTSLGVRTHGVLGRRDVPSGYIGTYIDLVGYLGCKAWVSRKELQITAGRAVRIMSRELCL